MNTDCSLLFICRCVWGKTLLPCINNCVMCTCSGISPAAVIRKPERCFTWSFGGNVLFKFYFLISFILVHTPPFSWRCNHGVPMGCTSGVTGTWTHVANRELTETLVQLYVCQQTYSFFGCVCMYWTSAMSVTNISTCTHLEKCIKRRARYKGLIFKERIWALKEQLASNFPYLSMRFMSWSPSPRRKRSRLADSMRQEHKASKRFSIISCSSGVEGLWRLNTWEGRASVEVLRKGTFWKLSQTSISSWIG